MKIGFDAKRAFLNSSGLGNYSRYTITGMTQLFPENEYTLYTTRTGLYDAPPSARIVMPEGFLSRRFPSAWRSLWLDRQLENDRIDLFHGLSNEIPLKSSKKHYKSCVTIHDLIFLRLPELYRASDRSIYRQKTRYAVRNADHIIATSEQTKRDLIELLHAEPSKVSVIYQGCNPLFYAPATIEEKERVRIKYALPDRYILYVGTVEERKNLLRVAEAMHLSGIDYPLIAAGKRTPYADRVESYVAEKKIRNFHLIGEVAASDLPALYQMAGVFIYPSVYEGFGIPVLEALNSGLPVITSAGGCLEESGGEGSRLINPLRSEEIGEALHEVLENTQLRRSMVENGLLHAMKFREQETIPKLFNVYTSCLK